MLLLMLKHTHFLPSKQLKMLDAHTHSPSSSSSSFPPSAHSSRFPHCSHLLNFSSQYSNSVASTISLSQNSPAITNATTTPTPTPKSSIQLKKEIAATEVEILHLERYILSLYRTAFKGHFSTASNLPRNNPPSQSQLVSCSSPKSDRQKAGSPASSLSNSDGHNFASSLQSKSTSWELKNVNSGRRSLADHLGASCLLDNLITPDKLSEDIVRCISSIYCRLAITIRTHLGFPTSPTSSLSSSSIFSSRHPCDSWSPHCNEYNMVHSQLQELKRESGPYAAMVEVLKINLDDDSFKYAAVMLRNFRSLVLSLEKVDPRRMKREEKLAFWINIHNALIMHAHLAYGTRNRIKIASILKAAYNVGGHCINACVIQNLIFGIQAHWSEPWLQTLFSPGRKFKTGSTKHVYALEYPEPLVHFALCSGAYSDPVVRVYTGKNIFQELKHAKEEFIQARIYMDKEAKIFLPKLLSYFAQDMSIDLHDLLEVISGCLTEVQQKAMKKCKRGKFDKRVQWIPQSSSFRYLVHRELAENIMGS